MSTFLGFDSFLISPGAIPATVLSSILPSFTIRGFQVVSQSVIPVAVLGTFGSTNNAWDDDSSTVAGGGAGWTGVQTQSPFTPTALHIVSENGASNQGPKAFTLDYSDDGITWTTLSAWSNEINWIPQERRVYTVAGAAAHSFWRVNITAANGGNAYVCGIDLVDAGNNFICTNAWVELIPPATETIGNSDAYEALRITVLSAGTTIQFQPVLYPVTARPMSGVCWQGAAGTVAPSLTLNGTTVTGPVGAAANTAKQNLRALYEAIRGSNDPNFTAFNWEYQTPAPQNADDTNDYIYFWQKSPGPNITISGTNINAAMAGRYAPAGVKEGISGVVAGTLNIDLINGFIYYIQVCSRSIAFATKTNSAYSGPVHASWATNSVSLAAMPPAFGLSKVTPVELLIGTDNDNTTTTSTAQTSHLWGIAQSTNTSFGGMSINYSYDWSSAAPFSRQAFRSKIQDYIAPYPYNAITYIEATLLGSNLFNGGNVSNDFQIHRMSLPNETIVNNWVTIVIPIMDVQDWYKFVGTATDEALLLVSDTVAVTPLATNVLASDTAIPVASTTGFQASGNIVVESEIIGYTGITPTAFTGCTRGLYGTSPANHFVGDMTGQGLWMVKIQGGALFAGYVKPS